MDYGALLPRTGGNIVKETRTHLTLVLAHDQQFRDARVPVLQGLHVFSQLDRNFRTMGNAGCTVLLAVYIREVSVQLTSFSGVSWSLFEWSTSMPIYVHICSPDTAFVCMNNAVS